MFKRLFPLFSIAAVLVLGGAGCIQMGASSAGPMGIFRSGDKGETWAPAVAMPTVKGVMSLSGLKVYRLFEDPSDVNAIYLGTRGQGLYYTYDNGDSWRSVSFMANKFIYALAVDPKDKCTIYVSDGQHIFKTLDCTRTWGIVYTEERPDQRVVSISIAKDDKGSVYAAVLGGDILKSEDAGRSWRAVKRFGFTLQQVSADPNTPAKIYVAAHRNGLYRSENSGTDWTELNEGFKNYSESQNFYRLILNPGKKDSLFWISKYGIIRSDDSGASWTDLKLITPPGSVNIYGFAINPKNQNEMYYTGTILGEKNSHIRSTFYKSVDGGRNWVTKKMPTNTIPAVMRIHPENTGMVFLGFTALEPNTQISF